jgi:virginiamycin B lyase
MFTEYGIPTAGSQPWGLDIDPGGTVWFTESAGNKIGALAPGSGLISEYAIPLLEAEPAGIVAGTRYVWLALPGADKFARHTIASGTFLDFSPLTPNSTPQDVALMADRIPWFTERSANKLLKFEIETTGWRTEISLFTADSEPFAIALERDEAVWFTQWAANRLGRFSGQLPPVEYALPTPGSQPTGIVVDSDDCVWYTAPGANRIGRLCLPIPYDNVSYLPIVFKD